MNLFRNDLVGQVNMESNETLKQEFTVQETYDYDNLIDEAIETISSSKEFLGGKKAHAPVYKELIDQLQQAKKMQVSLAKDLSCQKLSKNDFSTRNLKPSSGVEKYLQTHNFFLLTIPVTLMPVAGWAFTRLECWFGMVTDGSEPKIHDIYPEEAWIDVLKSQTGLQIGLDEGLKFYAGLKQTDLTYQTLSGRAKARVSVNAKGIAQMVVGPFQYSVSRSQVYSRGVENSQAFWRLDGRAHVEREKPSLSVVVRVSKDVTQLFSSAEFKVYQQFDFLGADMKDWGGDLRDKVKSFFSVGIPRCIKATWENKLA